MSKKYYSCYYEAEEGERMDISNAFYLIKEYRLVEITLDNWYYIRQRKDIPTQYVIDWETYDMNYWKVYCTSGNNVIESVWNWWGEEDLEKYIETCESYI